MEIGLSSMMLKQVVINVVFATMQFLQLFKEMLSR